MKTLIGLLIGLLIALGLTAFSGESPVDVFMILVKSAFGSKYDLGLTLYYCTSLTFTGLSVAVAYKSGLFNIGAEGQLHLAAITAAYIGAQSTLSPGATWIVLILTPLVISGLWAGIAGYLKAYRGSHEVIMTIMLNFISLSICNYVALQLIPNPDSQNPESKKLLEPYFLGGFDPLKSYFDASPISSFLIVAIVLSLVLAFFYRKTSYGLLLEAIGESPDYSKRLGFSVAKLQIMAMFMSGALAGLCGLNEVLGNSGQFKIGFSPEFGFLGIAVALMSQNNPLIIPLSAFLMGALHKGASDLDLETNTITRDFSKIMQALIIFGVSLHFFIDKVWNQYRRKNSVTNNSVKKEATP